MNKETDVSTMNDPHVLDLDHSVGERLPLDVYDADFDRRDSEVTGRASWKFERLQHFRELDNESWDALDRGDWDESLRLLEGMREGLADAIRGEMSRGNPFHRVRVVAEPLTPYLQWELHGLRLQAECGRPTRVVRDEVIHPLEGERPLPEVVVLGGRTLYEVVYTEEGLLDSAVRFTDPEVVQRWEAFIEQLYKGGEDVVSYTDRYVFRLPPPRLAVD
ncbi:DUF6879 family protein [Nocardiopsis sediminis]|uniref:DUF6879 family protein n=1 Tax=Nocardiopsis sediminis TaxID=1778267 RepID=A0ABV8FPI0_9ACTN